MKKRVGSGSEIQSNEVADPVPLQNVADPEHCVLMRAFNPYNGFFSAIFAACTASL
jgi:hypothetical protein